MCKTKEEMAGGKYECLLLTPHSALQWGLALETTAHVLQPRWLESCLRNQRSTTSVKHVLELPLV